MNSNDDVPLPLRPDWYDPARYDYTKTLSREGWAWEFLRRNPTYRAASRDAERSTVATKAEGGLLTIRRQSGTSNAEIWGLCSFRRSRSRRARGHCLLAAKLVLLCAARAGGAGARGLWRSLSIRIPIALPDGGPYHLLPCPACRVFQGGTAPPACGARWRYP